MHVSPVQVDLEKEGPLLRLQLRVMHSEEQGRLGVLLNGTLLLEPGSCLSETASRTLLSYLLSTIRTTYGTMRTTMSEDNE
jgi:hypothetical protein